MSSALGTKTLIFFNAFLPQFLTTGANYAQLALLGVIGRFFAAFTD